MKKQVAMIVILMMTRITNVYAQSWNLPANRKNTRITTDYFDIPRPALSMRGFDNLNMDADSGQQFTGAGFVPGLVKCPHQVEGSQWQHYLNLQNIKQLVPAVAGLKKICKY